jgi:hypothetical protein
MPILAHIVVSFGGGSESGAMLKAELDSVMNNNKSSFTPNDEIYFIIYKYPTDMHVYTPRVSSGQVVKIGPVTRTKTDRWTFTSNLVKDLGYPINSVSIDKWYGNIGTNVKKVANSLSIDGGDPCIGDGEYEVYGELWKLIPPAAAKAISGDETWPIVVHIQGDYPPPEDV